MEPGRFLSRPGKRDLAFCSQDPASSGTIFPIETLRPARRDDMKILSRVFVLIVNLFYRTQISDQVCNVNGGALYHVEFASNIVF